MKALGHNFKEISRVAATCEQDGYVNYKCSRCEEVCKEILKATGHNFVDGKCEYCGKLEDKPNEEQKPQEKPEEDKKDDNTTTDDTKLPQTGTNIILPAVGSFLIANVIASIVILKKKDNE